MNNYQSLSKQKTIESSNNNNKSPFKAELTSRNMAINNNKKMFGTYMTHNSEKDKYKLSNHIKIPSNGDIKKLINTKLNGQNTNSIKNNNNNNNNNKILSVYQTASTLNKKLVNMKK
jgi:hypothetical protein